MTDWLRRTEVGRNPAGGYTHLVRAAGDPERRGAAKEQGRGWSGYVLQRKLKQGCLGNFTVPILALLADAIPRTFNRIAVEMLDVTADVVFATPFEDALEELFDCEQIEMSEGLPIHWRIAEREPSREHLATRDGSQGDLFGNAPETVFPVRTGMFHFVCGVPSHRHGRHFCANGPRLGCDPSQKITLTAPRTAQKAQKDETSTLSSQSPQKPDSLVAACFATRRRTRQAQQPDRRATRSTRFDRRRPRSALAALRTFHRICRTLPASITAAAGAPSTARPTPLSFVPTSVLYNTGRS